MSEHPVRDTVPDTIIDFEAPPINEVVVGVRFARLKSLLIPHYGLFWSQIRDEFPSCEHAAPMGGDNGEVPVDLQTGLILPRVWLISASSSELVQLQSDRLLFNWRLVHPSDKYPRFPHVTERFADLFGRWSRFVDLELNERLELDSIEVSYINAIAKGDAWSSWGEVGRLLPDFLWRADDKRFLPKPDKLLVQFVLPMSDRGDTLTVRVNPAVRKTDQAELIRLELQARRLIDESDDEASIQKWLQTAREWIVRGFADLTDLDIQRRIWKREDLDG